LSDQPAIIDLADLAGLGGSARARGGSRLFRHKTGLVSQVVWAPEGVRRITGLFASNIANNLIVSRGPMLQSELTALGEGAQIGSGQIIFASQNMTAQQFLNDLNFVIEEEDRVYITFEGTNSGWLILYFDYS